MHGVAGTRASDVLSTDQVAQTVFGVTTSYRREDDGSLSFKMEGELKKVRTHTYACTQDTGVHVDTTHACAHTHTDTHTYTHTHTHTSVAIFGSSELWRLL